MSSIVPGYEYDIFISYRHNDNRSGWVTEFVHALQSELASTVKESISVYYDSNPQDGLLETHSVDKTLEGKLRSVLLVPIISQTYCDTNSFAWQNEFCVFNKQAVVGPLGRDIRLPNGNVASRILPVKIHDLDREDLSILENEIGGMLRAIEFIYKEPGVNRPLKPGDHRSDNQNKTDYRNQLNKVANAIKEILYGILKRNATTVTQNPVLTAVMETQNKPSVAVLPFANLSHDPEQEYFSDGVTENIISELASNKSLRIISRTSVMRYKKTKKSAAEIAEELNVQFILEGGVQTSGRKVRINVQLVEASKDDLAWSKVFMENLDDIFEIQSSVASVVARELNASIVPNESTAREKIPTHNQEAYTLFLKGRHAFNQWNVEGYKLATDYFKQAIALDPEFQQAYSYLASSFSARMSWNGDLSPNEALLHIEKYLAEAWKRGPSENDYLTRAFVEFFIHKNFKSTEQLLQQAIGLNANNANALYTYSYLLNIMGRFNEASQCVEQAAQIDPLTVAYFNYRAVCLYLTGDFEKVIQFLEEGLRLYPAVLRFYDFKARVYLSNQRWAEAEKAITDGFQLTTFRPPSMVAFLAIAEMKMGDQARFQGLLNELINRAKSGEKGLHIYMVYALSAQGEMNSAMHWFNQALKTNDVDLIWKDVDPLLEDFRKYLSSLNSSPSAVADFHSAEKHIIRLLEAKMPDLPYHNLNHIQDVVSAAMEIARHERVSEEEMMIVKLAAWLHDAGFIQSPKNHEETGAAMAREILPPFGFDVEQIKVIENMVMATRLPQTPNTFLEKILCDADLDYLGREDFYEMERKLFREMLEQGVVENEREWNLVQRTFLQSHRYHTNYSKTNRESSKQERLEEIVAKLKNRS